MGTDANPGNDGCDEPQNPRSSSDRPEQPEFRVSRVAAGVVSVAVRDMLPGRYARMLRDAVLWQIAQAPRMVIVEFVPVASGGPGRAGLAPASVAALVEVAREAGEADIGFCLVVPPDQVAPIEDALGAADVWDLFEIHPTVASALLSLP